MPSSKSPFSIELSARGQALLRNASGQAQWVLHEQHLQPSSLTLLDETGRAVPETDTRALKKFDNTVHRHLFRKLEPGQELPLFGLRVKATDQQYEIAYGPFRYGPVPAGTYQVSVTWQSQETRYWDEASQTQKPLDSVWTGTLRSAPVPVPIPLK